MTLISRRSWSSNMMIRIESNLSFRTWMCIWTIKYRSNMVHRFLNSWIAMSKFTLANSRCWCSGWWWCSTIWLRSLLIWISIRTIRSIIVCSTRNRSSRSILTSYKKTMESILWTLTKSGSFIFLLQIERDWQNTSTNRKYLSL